MRTARFWMASSLLAVATISTLPNATALEGEGEAVRIDLPSQPLSKALLAIGKATGRQIIFPGDVMQGLSAPAIHGDYGAREAVRRALAGTGFTLELQADTIFVHAPSNGGEGGQGDPRIVVTGSRIRGTNMASPVYSFDTAKARDQGITDMHALAAAIPQNFNGGQNPGVGSGAETAGSTNIDSSTALNLRGLGPGATLTLLNGHRLSYNQNNQSVDFSSIPFAAVERVEIMPDGASALYGSDAVGGVANIILKKDYQGLVGTAGLEFATDGGYFTQNYSLVGGTRWQSGSIVVTGNYDRNSAIRAGDRSFARTLNSNLFLYPQIKSYGFVGTGRQELSPDFTVSLDAVYSHRDARRETPYTAAEPVETLGLIGTTSTSNVSVAPTLTFKTTAWEFNLSGSFGRTHNISVNRRFPPFKSQTRTNNETWAAEFSGEGPLFAMPAGDVRLATGGGFRRDKYEILFSAASLRGQRDNMFGYAELSVPLTAPDQRIAGFHRTSLSAAVRYEDYSGAGRLATPKFGAVWSPVADIDLRMSWGRSFKVPTLYQRIYPGEVLLIPGDLYGSREAPPGQTIISIDGGRKDLRPEKASSFSAGISLHPRTLSGLNMAITYFSLSYRNRITTPVSALERVLIDPTFADLVTFSPSPEEIATAIALSPDGLLDQTDFGPFDPTQVYAIIDGRYRNVSSDKISGVDASVSYRVDAGDAGDFTVYGNATYLKSRRVLIAGQPSFDLAGTIFNPPHFKARGGISWHRDPLLVNAVVNRIGGVTDNRFVDPTKVDGMTTFDLSLKYHLGSTEHGLDLQISALNMFNAKPDVADESSSIFSFDSTNYSPIGRYLSLSLTKSL